MTRAALEKILSEVGYEEDKKKIIQDLDKGSLKESDVMNTGMVDELLAVKEWYLLRPANMDATSKSIKEVFTQALW
eukprot:6669221-Ditylum_brightwellii.AAC.1